VRAVSDQEQKGKSEEQHEEEEGTSASEEEQGSDEERDADEEHGSEEGGHDEGEPEGDDDASAQRVAESLGVGREGEIKVADADEEVPTAPVNRAARRAEAAQRRKKRKPATATAEGTDADAADDTLPKDKNARAKELLKRRREQASEARPIQLLPGEMVDDALARGSSAASKWLRENFTILQWVFLGALAAGGGYLFYQSRVDKTASNATAELMAGVNTDRGRVMAEDKRTDEEKEGDSLKVFKTADERADTALASYKKVIADHPGTGAAILARLGEAGDLLDKHDWDHALESFSAVSSSSLAGADADVKGRALEGIGFVKEGKGDLDGALAAFKELEGVDLRGYKELGLYHEGRMFLAKGDKDKAKDVLKQAHDKLEQPSTEGQSLQWLKGRVNELLGAIDPSLVPAKQPVMGGPKGGALTPEELDKLRRQFQEAMEKKGEKH
jgi:hypothetical protein